MYNNVFEKVITVEDLQPGDIITRPIAGVLHSAIYSPVAGKQADLIHLYINPKSNIGGLYKGTLSQQQQTLAKSQNLIVVRSCKPHG